MKRRSCKATLTGGSANGWSAKVMKSILIVEDEEPLLLAIQHKLEDAGFETIPTRDGKEALARLTGTEPLPDLIWLDYYLPFMNGLEFLTRIKSEERLKQIPVVVVSNTAGPEKVNAMLDLGVDAYFVKAERRLNEIIKKVQSIVNGGAKHE